MNETKIFLCTAGDTKYFQTKIFNLCLESYSKNNQLQKIIFLVDDKDENVNTYGIEKIFISWEEIESKNVNKCIQHGEFARYVTKANDEDILIFTDGDIVLQRDFTNQELELIKNLKSNHFLANFNLCYNSNMKQVLSYVGADIYKLTNFLLNNYISNINELENYKEMNTGVLIGRKKDFIKLANLYKEKYEELKSIITGFWNQQFLINIIINKYFNYDLLHYNFHTHIHHSIKTNDGCMPDYINGFGVPIPVIKNSNNKYTINNDIILFAHKFH